MDCVFGEKNFRNEIVWRMKSVSDYKSQAQKWIRDHDILLYYSLSGQCTFNKELLPYSQQYIDKMLKGIDKDGRRYWQRPNKRHYADDSELPVGTVWDDIFSLQTKTRSKEIVGYPTQKPIALLEQIITASSSSGIWCLTPFADVQLLL